MYREIVDYHNLYIGVKFQNADESKTFVNPNSIPKDNIFRQVALKIGKTYKFDIPNYQDLMEKLDEDTHAHVINIIIILSIFLLKRVNIFEFSFQSIKLLFQFSTSGTVVPVQNHKS